MYAVSAFYSLTKFKSDEVVGIHSLVQKQATDLDLRGLFIVSSEGLNCTVAGVEESIKKFEETIRDIEGCRETHFKRSFAEKMPFRRLSVQIREEAVTIKGEKEYEFNRNWHISPSDFQNLLADPEVIVLDVRNDYETKIGKFKDSVAPEISHFSQFPKYLQNSDLPKEKKYAIVCTGGIRCEKAIHEMHQQGYTDVWQLDGGILNYLEQFPNSQFEGECFVFDNRVSVDQELKPSSRYTLCPCCGNVAEIRITCATCGKETQICTDCQESRPNDPRIKTCSKNCAYHLGREIGASEVRESTSVAT